MEYSLRSDRFRIIPGKNLAVQEKKNSREKLDYILFRGVNRPIAVVEAKKSARSRVCNFLWAARSRLIDVGGDSVTK